MPPKPHVKSFLDTVNAVPAPPIAEQTPEAVREGFRALCLLRGEAVELASVVDRAIPGPAGDIPIRVYRRDGDENKPILVWYHGGGWCIGDLETHDAVCRSLADKADAVVVAVDYRLAPEHPFPAAIDDALAALHWIADNAAELGGDPSRLAVGGDSAGGNLAAVAALETRETGPRIRHQVLVYPVLDATMTQPSYDENGVGYVLTKATMEWFVGNYIGDGDPKSPRVSPLHVDDLRGAPPALIFVPELDPLRDEGLAYAAKLAEHDVPVECVNVDGQIHTFFGFVGMWPEADEAHERVAAVLREALA